MSIGPGDPVLAGYSWDLELEPAYLERLIDALLHPQSEPLRRLLDAGARGGDWNFTRDPELASVVEEGLARHRRLFLSEAAERRAVAAALLSRLPRVPFKRADERSGEEQALQRLRDRLAGIGNYCSAALDRSPKPLPPGFSADDLDRLLRARTLAAEVREVDEWPAWDSIAADMPRDVRALPEREALYRRLIARLESSARATLGKEPSDRTAQSFREKDYDMLAALRSAVGEPADGAAQQARIAERDRVARLREEVIRSVSPSWRDVFETLIDMPGADEPKQAEAFMTVFAPNEDRLRDCAVLILEDIERLRKRGGLFHWSLFDEISNRPLGNRRIARISGSTSWTWLERLANTLRAEPRRIALERAARLASPAFEDFAAAIERGRAPDAFDSRLESLIRAGRHGEAEAELRLLFEGAPESDLKTAILATPVDSVRLTGWDPVLGRLGDPTVTALGLRLSAGGAGAEDESDRAAAIVSFYRDPVFSDPDALLAMSVGDNSADRPGTAEAGGASLEVAGLAGLLRALRSRPESEWRGRTRPDLATAILARWWTKLVFFRAAALDADTLRPGRAVPLLVGFDGFGPSLGTVLLLCAAQEAPPAGPARPRSAEAAAPADDDDPFGQVRPIDWTSDRTYRRLDRALADLLRRHRFDEARGHLLRLLRTRADPLADLCLAMESREVEILGWPKLQALALYRDRDGRAPGAIQVNYSGQGDFADGRTSYTWADGSSRVPPAHWWMSAAEISLLGDDDRNGVDFRHSSLEDIAKARPSGSAWPGGDMRSSSLLLVRGLEELQGALIAFGDEFRAVARPGGHGVRALAEWYFALRWNHAMARALREWGMPRPIVVVVGFHDCGPSLDVAHRPALSGKPDIAPPIDPRDDRDRLEAEIKERRRQAEERDERNWLEMLERQPWRESFGRDRDFDESIAGLPPDVRLRLSDERMEAIMAAFHRAEREEAAGQEARRRSKGERRRREAFRAGPEPEPFDMIRDVWSAMHARHPGEKGDAGSDPVKLARGILKAIGRLR